MKTKLTGSAGRFRTGLERLSRGLRKWRDDRRGAIAVQFAFLVVPLAVLALGLVDLNRMNTQKYNLQDSLDAAALYAARSNATNDAEIQVQGVKALNANLRLMPNARVISSTFDLDGVAVIADAEIELPAVVSDLWTNQPLRVKVHSEVNRNANNIEVALVLDATGSMAGQKMTDLKAAANELIDIVVKTQQTPFYSKVAIVPYSMAVNVDTAAAQVRGAIPAGKSITASTWWKGSEKNLSNIAKTNPARVTSNGHGLANGEIVYLWNVNGNIDRRAFTVTNSQTNTFDLSGADNTGGSTSSSGKFRTCLFTNCDSQITASSHGFQTNDRVHITEMSSATYNEKTFPITRQNGNTFLLVGSGPGSLTSNAASGGSAWCTVLGCQFYYFNNASNAEGRTHEVSTCVSERTGSSAYTDESPATSKLGYNYAPDSSKRVPDPYVNNPCTNSKVYPLSSVRQDLKDQIGLLSAGGSTGGHVGVAWGWYMVSPNFGHLWPSASSRPAAYSTPATLKFVVLMTDGEYNSAYCNGVISADSTTGSGDARDHINCNAPNGHAFAQSMALCSAMKAAGVTVYTVGFQIVNDQRARDLVNGCATSANHVHIANSGQALKDSFAAIGAEIDNLRLTK